jgi:hypothetical protein
VTRSGKRARVLGAGLGHVVWSDVIKLPSLKVQLGGYDAVARPAWIVPKAVGSERNYGLLGEDLLTQAPEVTIDFEAMRLTLR